MTAIIRQRLLGALFFVVLLGLVLATVLAYNKAWDRTVNVQYRTDDVGFALVANADVKVNGVMAGRVSATRPEAGQVVVDLALDPDVAGQLPGNVTARLLPKTLFGERYVDLTLPAQREGELRSGAVIEQDLSGNSVEVSVLLDNLLPVLEAVPPANLARTLGALSSALSGKGELLGRSIDNLDALVSGINETTPELNRVVRDFGTAAKTYETALPDLVSTLDNLRTTTGTLSELQAPVSAAMASVSQGAVRTSELLEANREELVSFAWGLRGTLEYLAKASPAFACTFENFSKIVDLADDIVGLGDVNPGVRSTIKIVNPKGRYLPNQDEPRFFDDRGTRCYSPAPAGEYYPMAPGGAIADGAYGVPSRNPGPAHMDDLPTPQFGLSNAEAKGVAMPLSTIQRAAYQEILAAGMGATAEDVAPWTVLLAAPVLANSEVSIE